MKFGEAIEKLKEGKKVTREGWSGKGHYLQLQCPDNNSKMNMPYIYIVLNPSNSNHYKLDTAMVPWNASQTDMLCEDWEIID